MDSDQKKAIKFFAGIAVLAILSIPVAYYSASGRARPYLGIRLQPVKNTAAVSTAPTTPGIVVFPSISEKFEQIFKVKPPDPKSADDARERVRVQQIVNIVLVKLGDNAVADWKKLGRYLWVIQQYDSCVDEATFQDVEIARRSWSTYADASYVAKEEGFKVLHNAATGHLDIPEDLGMNKPFDEPFPRVCPEKNSGKK